MSTASEKLDAIFEYFNCHVAIKSTIGRLKHITKQLFLFEDPGKTIPPGLLSENRPAGSDKYLYLPKEKFLKLEIDDLKCGKCQEGPWLSHYKRSKGRSRHRVSI